MDATLTDTQYGRILAKLTERIQGISVAGGYHFDVKPDSVMTDPVNLFNVDATDCPIFLVEPMHDAANRRQWQPANQIEDHWPVLITARLLADSNDPFAKMALALNAHGDLERAITKDGQDPTLDGVVIDVLIQPLQPPPIPGFQGDYNVFVLMEVVAHYSRQYGTP